jgi:hypothetical protein
MKQLNNSASNVQRLRGSTVKIDEDATVEQVKKDTLIPSRQALSLGLDFLQEVLFYEIESRSREHFLYFVHVGFVPNNGSANARSAARPHII